MKNKKPAYASGLAALLCIIAIQTNAEIYKSTDAQGNTVYSDTPPEGATTETVDLAPGNYADAPEKPSEQPAHTVQRKPTAPQRSDQDGHNRVVVIGDDDAQDRDESSREQNYDLLEDEYLEAQRRQSAARAKARHEIKEGQPHIEHRKVAPHPGPR